ncbi:MAG: DUF1385 domain-containing protein [Armatimonadetes bacterium]|nr:DUF1385 domain-containing protein [Armatimonadota bacterium]MDW8122237.1 DUF1385 domain-containing protein [Armatimonadota bacterium]
MKAGYIVRRCPVVRPTDSIGKAAEMMRQAQCPLLPVAENDRIVAVVEDQDLLRASLNSHQALTVADVMKRPQLVVDSEASVQQVAWLLDHNGLAAVAVADGSGSLKGIVTRSDVAAALTRGLRPHRIGGMATPWGVFLTTGNHRAGVGNLAVFTTGVVMALCLAFASVSVLFLLHLVDGLLGTDFLTAYVLQRPPSLAGSSFPWSHWLLIIHLLQGFIFFLTLRVLPLTGYHGGEHQVVHAIEQGEDLTVEAVSRMPLEHPRCGTNLAALVILLTTVAFSNIPAPFMLFLFVVILLTWRPIGMVLQRLFTVRKPTKRQLERAIEAGKEILQRYQNLPHFRPPLIVQIWNLGLVQVLCGASLTLLVLNQMAAHLQFPRLIF